MCPKFWIFSDITTSPLLSHTLHKLGLPPLGPPFPPQNCIIRPDVCHVRTLIFRSVLSPCRPARWCALPSGTRPSPDRTSRQTSHSEPQRQRTRWTWWAGPVWNFDSQHRKILTSLLFPFFASNSCGWKSVYNACLPLMWVHCEHGFFVFFRFLLSELNSCWITIFVQIEGATASDGRGPCIWDEFVKLPGRCY